MSKPTGDRPPLPRPGGALPGSGIRRDLRETWGTIKAKAGSDLETGNAEARLVSPDRLQPNPDQPRRTFDPARDEELTRDIAERGILEPLIVRPVGEDEQGSLYQIVAGERRYRAALSLSLTRIPVIVKDFNDREARLAALVENLQRLDLDPLDEASYFQLLTRDYNYSYRKIAQMVNRSPAYIHERLKRLADWQDEDENDNLAEETNDSEIFNKRSDSEQKLQKSQTSVRSILGPIKRFQTYVERTRLRLPKLSEEERSFLVQEIKTLKEELASLEEEYSQLVSRETNPKS